MTIAEIRLEKFLVEVEGGVTLQDIGEREGISRERVRQIVSRSDRYDEIKSVLYWKPRYERAVANLGRQLMRFCATDRCDVSLAFMAGKKKYCDGCGRERALAQGRRNVRRIYAERRKKGLCYCGREPDPGVGSCSECRKNNRVYYLQRKGKGEEMEIKRMKVAKQRTADSEQCVISSMSEKLANLFEDSVMNEHSMDLSIMAAREIRLSAQRIERALRAKKEEVAA